MPESQKIGPWDWVVLSVSLGAYVPLIAGGWKHPSETNVACFGVWVILALVLTISGWYMGYASWKLSLAFFVGNVVTVVTALLHGGYTYNIDDKTTIAIYSMASVLLTWVIVGALTKRWHGDIIYIGTILVDISSFYPVLKQYTGWHERVTLAGITAWTMFGAGVVINCVFVEKFFRKLRLDPLSYGMTFGEKKSYPQIIKGSAFSIENFTMIVLTLIAMTR